MPPRFRPLAALVLSLLLIPQAHAESFTGKVVRVLEGLIGDRPRFIHSLREKP